jgi:hypothetical protein
MCAGNSCVDNTDGVCKPADTHPSPTLAQYAKDSSIVRQRADTFTPLMGLFFAFIAVMVLMLLRATTKSARTVRVSEPLLG